MSLGSRMKDYEFVSKQELPKRMPVIIRIDGKAFHTYTKDMAKPFSEKLARAMWETSIYLAKNISGCKLAYTQSDEISLLLTSYEKFTTEPWFNNNVQKLVSVSASLATAKFNEIMKSNDGERELALFDARAWVLPHDEVCNYFIWRQQDATTNSVNMVAQNNFSHRELQGLSNSTMQDKLMMEAGVNWNDIPVWQKRGASIIKLEKEVNGTVRNRWVVDFETPIFSKSRDYVDRFVYLERQEEIRR